MCCLGLVWVWAGLGLQDGATASKIRRLGYTCVAFGVEGFGHKVVSGYGSRAGI